VVLPINDELSPYADRVKCSLEEQGLRADLDDRTESLNKKVRDAQIAKVPLILTIGEKERDSGTFSVRTLDGKVRHGVAQRAFMNRVREHIRERRLGGMEGGIG
jgi:threonyl-tRNA synthetase